MRHEHHNDCPDSNGFSAESAFPPTRWTRVRVARDFRERATAMAEFSNLCGDYWFPLYGFARRRGHPPERAADHTQEFFLQLAQGDILARADPEKGRLRTFFLTVFTRQLANARECEQAAKRGGGGVVLELDQMAAEERLANEPADPGLTPERWYDRQWALTLLEQCLHRLAASMAGDGRDREFQALRPFLSVTEIATASTDDAARTLGVSPETLRQKISRLRTRFREVLERQVAESLASPSPAMIADEIRALQLALTTTP